MREVCKTSANQRIGMHEVCIAGINKQSKYAESMHERGFTIRLSLHIVKLSVQKCAQSMIYVKNKCAKSDPTVHFADYAHFWKKCA